MQTVAIPAFDYISRSTSLASMHRLRARVFADRLGWDVDVRDGEEHDEFDRYDPTYIVAIDEQDTVAACARLLPATGPTMLELTFPQLLSTGSLHAHEAMIESSRFCVDTSLIGGRGESSLHQTTLSMFAAIIEWSIAGGYTDIVTATDLRFERILNRAGWPMQRLGDPCAIGNTVAVAGQLPADQASFERVCPPSYQSAFSRSPETVLKSAA